MKGRIRSFIILIFIGAVIIIYNNYEEKEYDRKYLNELNLELTGKVVSVDVPDGFNSFGILNVQISSSNIQSYDPGGKWKSYYCLINGGMAELYQIHARLCAPGDSIVVSTKNNQVTIIKPNGTKLNSAPVIYKNEHFYEYAARKHRSKKRGAS